MNKKITIPARLEPDSIRNVVSVVVILGNRGLGFADIESFSLDGTVEEKLSQYKEATGKDWAGMPEQTYTVAEEQSEPVSLGLCQKKPYQHINPATAKAQEKINALVKLASEYLEEAKREKIEKQKNKIRTARLKPADTIV